MLLRTKSAASQGRRFLLEGNRCAAGGVLSLQGGPGHAVGAEILDVVDIQQGGEAKASSVHAALDRADGAAADACCLFVGES